MMAECPEGTVEVFVPTCRLPNDVRKAGVKVVCSVVDVNGRLEAADVVIESQESIEESLQKFRITLGPHDTPSSADTSTSPNEGEPIPDWSSILQSFYGADGQGVGDNPEKGVTPASTSALASIFDEMIIGASTENPTLSRSSSDLDFLSGKNDDAEYPMQPVTVDDKDFGPDG